MVTGVVLAVVQVLTEAGWAPLLFLGAGVFLLLCLGIRAVVRRSKQPKLDNALPWRDDRRDLADSLEGLAGELAGFLDSSALERPAIEGRNLEQMLATVQGESREQTDLRRKASEHYDRTELANYYVGFRPTVLNLYDKAVAEGVAAASFRGRFEKPGEDLKHLPDHLRELAERLRRRKV